MKLQQQKKENHPSYQAAYQKRTRQTVADAGATARRAIAITGNGLEAAKGIHIRALNQRDASRE